MVVKDDPFDRNDRLLLSWTRGAQTVLSDFGDPTTNTDYGLCVYDESSGVPALIMAAEVPAGGNCTGQPCWKGNSRGFKYNNRASEPDGVQKVKLQIGEHFRSAIKIKAGGPRLSLPTPASDTLFFHQDTKVTVQLVNTLGPSEKCWTSEFLAPAEVNDGSRFKDKEL